MSVTNIYTGSTLSWTVATNGYVVTPYDHASVLVSSDLSYAIDFQMATNTKLQLLNPYSAEVTITQSNGLLVPVDMPLTVADANV